MTQHQHQAVRERGPYGFTHSVAVHPYTQENRAAHGGIMVVEVCECGYERHVNRNGVHVEFGTWRPSQAMLDERARQQRERRERQEREQKARALLDKSIPVLPFGRTVDVAPGVTLIVGDAITADDLLDDDTVVEVSLCDPYPEHRAQARIADLRTAGRQWAHGPADDHRAKVYPAVAAALP